MKSPSISNPDISPSWLEALDEEDLAFLKRFLLSSGSLKDIAKSYGVSYPTVRLRVDRLIQKVEVADELVEAGPFERRLRLLLADGTIDAATFRMLLRAHEEEDASKNP
jgi:hypothetical protein